MDRRVPSKPTFAARNIAEGRSDDADFHPLLLRHGDEPRRVGGRDEDAISCNAGRPRWPTAVAPWIGYWPRTNKMERRIGALSDLAEWTMTSIALGRKTPFGVA